MLSLNSQSLDRGNFYHHPDPHEEALMCGAIGAEEGYRVTIKTLSNLLLTAAHAFNSNAPKISLGTH